MIIKSREAFWLEGLFFSWGASFGALFWLQMMVLEKFFGYTGWSGLVLVVWA